MEQETGAVHKMDVTQNAAHPLQDVDLSQSLAATVPETSTKTVKKNWVKFDDEVNDGEGAGTGAGGGENNNSNNNIDSTDSAATAPDTMLNKLSTLPPPPAKQPTTTTVKTNTNVVAPTEKIMNKHSAAVAPVQRSTVSSSTAETEIAPAVLTTESTHVNLNASGKTQQQQQHPTPQERLHRQQLQQQQQHKPKASSVLSVGSPQQATATTTTTAVLPQHGARHHNNNGASNKTQSVAIPVESTPPMRTIELSTGRIREGFANGDVIVTLLPANTKWPWITPAIFRPELVPEELMAQGLTLTVEEYVNAMETLVNDYRFTVYNICYKRILVCWIFFAFAVLLALLFSGLQGVALFSLGVGWLFLNAAAIFLCMWLKLRLARGLEKCLARVNKQLMRHKILLILDDRGRISCHKVNLCFLYFDAAQCVSFLNEFLEHTEQNGGEAIKAGWEAKLDLDLNDIVIQGNNPVRLSRKQAVAQEIFLSYLQRWGKDFLRRRLDWTVQEAGVHETPRHLQSSICPCQYEEEVLRNKIKMHLQRKQCCGINCISCWL